MRTLPLLAAVVGCSGDDGKDPGTTSTGETGAPSTTGDTGTPGASFVVLGDAANLPAASILSIWGTGSDNVWMVGADPEDGLGPLALHFDGSTWTRLATGSTGDLWWVWSDGADTVLMSGAAGRMITHSVSAGTFSEAVITDPTYKLFGTWGTGPDDVWSVGGDVNGGLNGIALHYDGTAWTEQFQAPVDPDDGVSKRQIFKVWGAAADDVWFVGTGALLMHWDGSTVDTTWDQPVYHTTPFITVSGRSATDVVAVGGFGNAAVVHWDGASWGVESPPPVAIAPGFNGVYASQLGSTVACGQRGSIWWRDGTAWEVDPRPAPTSRDFHACWIDETGEPWAVGGDLTSNSEAIVVTGNPGIPPISF